MSTQKHITIGGVQYDAHTGLRVEEASPVAATSKASATPKRVAPAHAIHKRTTKSQTLSRSHVKAPHKQSPAARPAVKKSPMVHKFAPATSHKTTAVPQKATRVISDIGPVKHPLQAKAQQRKTTEHRQVRKAAVHHAAPVHSAHHQVTKPQPKPAHVIKQESITKALHNATPHKPKKASFKQRFPRLVSTGSASLAIVLLAGYLTYVNLPNISVRVASAQAGIAASYPSYKPSGYSLAGPVAFSDGKVTMKFAANVGPQNFTIDQTKSSWDSSALRENYVERTSNGKYDIYSDNGLTIYTYEDGAAWVNGGILHTIDSEAPLSGDQIRRIATSL